MSQQPPPDNPMSKVTTTASKAPSATKKPIRFIKVPIINTQDNVVTTNDHIHCCSGDHVVASASSTTSTSNVGASSSTSSTSCATSVASSSTEKLSTGNNPTSQLPSEHEGKRFEQVILMCAKCNACLAVSKLNGPHMFSAFKSGDMKDVVLKDENVIGNSIIENPFTNKKNDKKISKFKKTHVMICKGCGEKVGSRMNGNFPKTEIPKRMFDGTACKVSCEEKNGQNVIMKVKEWRELKSSLKYYGLYPNTKAKEDLNDFKREFKKKDYHEKKPFETKFQKREFVKPEQKMGATKPVFDNQIQHEPIRTIPLMNSSFSRSPLILRTQANNDPIQQDPVPKKEKKDYTIRHVKAIVPFIENSLLKEGNQEYFVTNLMQDSFKSIFNAGGILEQEVVPYATIEKLISLFANDHFDRSIDKTKISSIFSYFMNSHFYRKLVRKFVKDDIVDEEQVQFMVKVFHNCLLYCPLEAERVFIEDLEKTYIEKFVNNNPFKESIMALKSKKQSLLSTISKMDKGTIDVEHEATEGIEENEFEEISVFPTWNELTSNTKFNIRNKIDGPYSSLRDYIRTQIFLLREDFIHPLKEGIHSFLSNDCNHRSISVFTDVQFVSVISSDNERELVHSLSFHYPWKKVNWECSKKLAFGSLLCLFPQNGSGKNATIQKNIEPIFVTVLDRKLVGKGVVYVSLSRVEDFRRLSLDRPYVMFESPAYFPSVRPVIDSLNMILSETLIDHAKFSFFDEFVKVSKTQRPPEYIEKDSFMSLDVIKGNTRKTREGMSFTETGKTNILSNWIDDSDTFLDSSQNKAIQHVMNNRVSIVIGPPGCGKTFTGIEIAKLLKSHRDMRDRQLVCITYTNHALDQFLEGLIDYFPNIVRIGSRSKSQNQKLLDRNLSKLRFKSIPRYLYQEKLQLDEELREMSRSIGATELSIKNPDDSLYRHLSKSITFSRSLSKFPNHLYTRRNPPPSTLYDMFKAWLSGDDLRRKESIQKHMKNINRTDNSFRVLQEDDYQSDEEEVEMIEEIPHRIVNPNPKYETNNDTEEVEENIEEVIEAELINEEMLNRFGYEENQITNGEAITLMYEDLVDEEDIKNETSDEIKRIEELVRTYRDIYRIPLKKRILLLTPLKILNEKLLRSRLIDLTIKRSELENRKYEILQTGDYSVLEKASIIGLTSTAASMNRNLLNKLKAPVYLIEEAAELLECQITSVLHPNVEHLIMIGDEKQLQPKVNSYFLEKHCDFTVSLFERLIMNGLEYSSLNVQQRMRPEIRELVDMFYEKLYDHESVKHFENVTGVGTNVCFIEHKKLEKTSEDVQSLTNPHEAEFLCKFSKYLLNVRQYKASQITILTPYRGQVILIKKLLRDLINQDLYRELRVSTVDDYQGEENEIILLSLVRSNNFDNLGFVKITNRIIVSLSRAKKGLYIIGNRELLKNNEDWRKVFAKLKHSNRILDYLPLSCPKHTEEKECIREPSDFDGVIWGGCKKPCTHRYPCGHLCTLPCHHDSLHKERKCEKICDELHKDCGHRCKEKCHHGKSCPPCKTMVDYKFTNCNHIAKVPCHSKQNPHLCKLMCGRQLDCGHKCRGECGKCALTGCGPCLTLVKDSCETCKKPYERKCSDERSCTNRCTFKLPCGHNCSGTCGECSISGTHKTCGFNCERKLICGHTCKAKHTCSNPCPKCEETCLFKCFHNIQCNLKCHEMCHPCKEPCPIQCPHRKCSNLCHEPCNVGPCNEKCPKHCPKCNHQCRGLCGEPCPPCMFCDALDIDEENEENEMWSCPISLLTFKDISEDEDIKVYHLPDCGHTIELESMDNCVKSFFDTDQGISIKYLSCPLCRTAIFTAPRYQNEIKQSIKRMENIKYVIYKKAEEERKEAIKAVSAGYASGHWFACPNGHPYFIGECGGAMQQSKCIDCGADIGGSSHRLLASNRLATEIDGSTAAAWPTALNR